LLAADAEAVGRGRRFDHHSRRRRLLAVQLLAVQLLAVQLLAVQLLARGHVRGTERHAFTSQ
jgi:hypothetical protein